MTGLFVYSVIPVFPEGAKRLSGIAACAILKLVRERKVFWLYIMTNTRRGVLYTGVTTDLVGRVGKHRAGALPGFTKRYGLKRLVWYEEGGDAHETFSGETRIKRWRRAWKIALVESTNPEWNDLWYQITGQDVGPPLI
jgi:putative endonuclease